VKKARKASEESPPWVKSNEGEGGLKERRFGEEINLLQSQFQDSTSKRRNPKRAIPREWRVSAGQKGETFKREERGEKTGPEEMFSSKIMPDVQKRGLPQ